MQRHPNFWAEQGMWWCFYGLGVGASGQVLNWTGVGALLLSLLFQGSTDLTEKLTLRKYPSYALYQARTSRLMPWFPRHGEKKE
jgi:steroid 5-alpha reductase family enzyme